MKRQRRRGLGSTAREHAKMIRGDVHVVQQTAAVVISAVARDRCSEAFDALTAAHNWKGRMTADSVAARAWANETDNDRGDAAAAVSRADKAFWDQCVRRERR